MASSGWAFVAAGGTFSSSYVDVNPNSRSCTVPGGAQARRTAAGTATTNSACSDDYATIDFVPDPSINGGVGPHVFRSRPTTTAGPGGLLVRHDAV